MLMTGTYNYITVQCNTGLLVCEITHLSEHQYILYASSISLCTKHSENANVKRLRSLNEMKGYQVIKKEGNKKMPTPREIAGHS